MRNALPTSKTIILIECCVLWMKTPGTVFITSSMGKEQLRTMNNGQLVFMGKPSCISKSVPRCSFEKSVNGRVLRNLQGYPKETQPAMRKFPYAITS